MKVYHIDWRLDRKPTTYTWNRNSIYFIFHHDSCDPNQYTSQSIFKTTQLKYVKKLLDSKKRTVKILFHIFLTLDILRLFKVSKHHTFIGAVLVLVILVVILVVMMMMVVVVMMMMVVVVVVVVVIFGCLCMVSY